VLHPREGLVLYDVRFAGRRLAYRVSASEAYVPYGIGDTNWLWRSAFDIGEYGLGYYAQTLEVDHDVPSNAQFLSATFANDTGGAANYPNSLGVYEKFDGLAVDGRTDPSTALVTRRGAAAPSPSIGIPGSEIISMLSTGPSGRTASLEVMPGLRTGNDG
jgi:primary-amine oxidase